MCQVLGEVQPPALANRARELLVPATPCLLPYSLTLHGLDEVPDSVGPDAKRGTLLHELGRDVAICVQVVHCLRIQLH